MKNFLIIIITSVIIFLFYIEDNRYGSKEAMSLLNNCIGNKNCFWMEGSKSIPIIKNSAYSEYTNSCSKSNIKWQLKKESNYDGGNFYFFNCMSNPSIQSTVWHQHGAGHRAFIKECTDIECEQLFMPI